MQGWESLDIKASSGILVLSSIELGNVLGRAQGGESLSSLGVFGGEALAVSAIK